MNPTDPRPIPDPLKVALVCHSDQLGGAAIVTFRLMQALRTLGVDARMIVYNRMTTDEQDSVVPVYEMGPRWRRGAMFVMERLGIFLANGFSRENLFKVSTASAGMPLHRHPWVREADVIHLNWFNQGLLSLRGLRRLAALGKPMVWTMHDMWAMTGICHHAYSCTRFMQQCGECQFLGSNNPADLSHRVWGRKLKLYRREGLRLKFVAVSNWLRSRAAASSLLRDVDVEVIPNAFPVDTFPIRPYSNFPTFDPIPQRRRMVMGAARLDDPVKDFPMAIDALNYLFDNFPDEIADTGIILFGELRNRALLDRLRFPHLYMGSVSDQRAIRQYYASADVVISTSHFETLPGTLIEGQAAGCLAVTFGNGGQADIVTHLSDGYIVDERTPQAFAEGIRWALRQKADRAALHESVAARFAADNVARRYISLYRSM